MYDPRPRGYTRTSNTDIGYKFRSKQHDFTQSLHHPYFSSGACGKFIDICDLIPGEEITPKIPFLEDEEGDNEVLVCINNELGRKTAFSFNYNFSFPNPGPLELRIQLSGGEFTQSYTPHLGPIPSYVPSVPNLGKFNRSVNSRLQFVPSTHFEGYAHQIRNIEFTTDDQTIQRLTDLDIASPIYALGNSLQYCWGQHQSFPSAAVPFPNQPPNLFFGSETGKCGNITFELSYDFGHWTPPLSLRRPSTSAHQGQPQPLTLLSLKLS